MVVLVWYYMIRGVVLTSEKSHVVERTSATAGDERDVGVYYCGAKHVLVEPGRREKTMQREQERPAQQCSRWEGSFTLVTPCFVPCI